MLAVRRGLAVFLASLVAWFGVAAAAPVHAHAMDSATSVFLHMVADDAHDDHADHHAHHAAGDAEADVTGDAPADAPDREPVLHAHGCSHVATMADGLVVSRTVMAAPARWVEADDPMHSILSSPPRKPPRTLT